MLAPLQACGRVLAIKSLEQLVQLGVLLAHLDRLIEKTLGRHGKELVFVDCAVWIEQRRLTGQSMCARFGI